MKFFKNLKAEIKSRLEKPVFSHVQTISDSDVALLAVMCRMCSPVVTKKHIFFHIFDLYAYYVPQLESDINIAKDIFEKNGIMMNFHYSHIISREGQEVLRVNYATCSDKNKLVCEMTKIEQKYVSLYTPDSKEEKAKLWEQVIKLRQNQK